MTYMTTGRREVNCSGFRQIKLIFCLHLLTHVTQAVPTVTWVTWATENITRTYMLDGGDETSKYKNDRMYSFTTYVLDVNILDHRLTCFKPQKGLLLTWKCWCLLYGKRSAIINEGGIQKMARGVSMAVGDEWWHRMWNMSSTVWWLLSWLSYPRRWLPTR